MTGQMINEQIMNRLLSGGLQLEIFYSFIIIACSLMIYFGTKKIYELTGHKGIKYFRLSFLFFAIAYFFRSFIKFIVIYFSSERILEIPPQIFGEITLMLFIYFSSMAVFYLLYSVIYKKIKMKKAYLHLVAIIFAIVVIVTINPFVYLIINLILLFILSLTVYLSRSKSKKSNICADYILLFIFWALGTLDILIPTFLKTFQLIIYLSSSGIFLVILYKVLKRAGN